MNKHMSGSIPEAETPEQRKLCGILNYLGEITRQSQPKIFSLDQYRSRAYFEHELKGKIGIKHDAGADGDPIWLRVERLKRVKPPTPAYPLQAWLSIEDDPTKRPSLQDVVVRTMSGAIAAELLSSGRVTQDDVALTPETKRKSGFETAKAQRVGDWGADDTVDVVMRLQKFPEISEEARVWIESSWTEWAAVELPRRQTIAIYENLFSTSLLLNGSSASTPLELVWGVGLARWNTAKGTLNHPLLEKAVEMEIADADGAITIRPRALPPTLALNPYDELGIPTTQDVRKFAQEFIDREDLPFSPFDTSSFAPVLRKAVTMLDERGSYHPATSGDPTDRSVPPAGASLTITDTWVIYLRPKSADYRLQDIEKLAEAVRSARELAAPAIRIVTEPSNEPPRSTSIEAPRHGGGFLGLGAGITSGSGDRRSASPTTLGRPADDGEFFFPLPFNDEQRAIILRLRSEDGVVVQGPPGTGKTHTIANIICHMLATGKRVLVTSKGEAALAVLRDKIPDSIRDLVISLLSNERAGLKQLERAVEVLAATTADHRPDELSRQIADAEGSLRRNRSRIEAIDAQMHDFARQHLQTIRGLDGRDDLPWVLAEAVSEQTPRHTWFPDKLGLAKEYEPQMSSDDMLELKLARTALGADLCYLGFDLPRPSDLPDASRCAAVHRDLLAAERITAEGKERNRPILSTTVPNAIDRAEALRDQLKVVASKLEALEAAPWVSDLRRAGSEMRPSAFEHAEILACLDAFDALEAEWKEVRFFEVTIELPAWSDNEVRQALARASESGRPFGLVPFGKTNVRHAINGIRIAGRVPATKDDWRRINQAADLFSRLDQLRRRWSILVENLGMPVPDGDIRSIVRGFEEIARLIRSARSLDDELDGVGKELGTLFPFRMLVDTALGSSAGARAAHSDVEANLAVFRLASSRRLAEEIVGVVGKSKAPIVTKIDAYARHCLGSPNFTPDQVSDIWVELCAELQRLRNLWPHLETVSRVSDLVERSGAANWARRLRDESVEGRSDLLVPEDWRESWNWARLHSHLKEIDARARIKALTAERAELDRATKRIFVELVRLNTNRRLNENMTNKVKSALVKFTTALRRIGAGTGRMAPIHQRDAREAMKQCYAAVPCWIMPSDRVSEVLPSEIGAFDLVIIDEASQSDVTGIPAMLRGKKLLVVGDDKQVSPTAGFLKMEHILRLRHHHLQDQPFAQLLTQGNSLYDLAMAAFPGERIMLREHFRCVEPIIRWSQQFYSQPLLPVRLPKGSERLDPPLIDVYVPFGVQDRAKHVNRAEAEGIVEEIARVAGDATLAGRSIGVVSLVGHRQARLIQELLLEKVGEETFRRHRIMCGDSATFQGDERDIVFLSMVECPGTSVAKTALQFQQRFNVAVSRARDRAYLFRSVTLEQLNPNDLKAKLIGHFHEPMRRRSVVGEDQSALCESGFERDVYRRLREKAYRVTPQVRVGPFSIDLVVEGDSDSRLAIELDGDQYHGPDRWTEDLNRQRILERVGWTFWRCWGSSFRLDPQGCIDDLVTTLDGMGIHPANGEAIRSDGHSRHYVLTRDWRLADGTVAVDNAAIALPDSLAPEVEPRAVEAPPGSLVPANEVARASETSWPKPEDVALQACSGDTLLISFLDDPTRLLTWTLVSGVHEPSEGRVSTSHALGEKLIGAMADDEIEIAAGGEFRKIVVQRIERREDQSGEVPPSVDEGSAAACQSASSKSAAINAVPHLQPVRSEVPASVASGRREIGHYEIANLLQVVPLPDADEFFKASYSDRLQRMIERLISVEGPVLGGVIVRRIAKAHGFKRSGRKIREHVLGLVHQDFPRHREECGTFYWSRGATLGAIPCFRRTNASERRPIQEICSAELEALARELDHLRDEQVRLQAMADAIGLRRIRLSTRTRLLSAILRSASIPGGAAGHGQPGKSNTGLAL